MPVVDRVQYRLADQMIADRKQLQPVLLQDRPLTTAVIGIGQRLVDLEVISKASQLQAVKTEGFGHRSQSSQRKIRPLTGT